MICCIRQKTEWENPQSVADPKVTRFARTAPVDEIPSIVTDDAFPPNRTGTEKLMRDQPPVGPPRHYVSERAANIDGKGPSVHEKSPRACDLK
jgi:hypothetical protein